MPQRVYEDDDEEEEKEAKAAKAPETTEQTIAKFGGAVQLGIDAMKTSSFWQNHEAGPSRAKPRPALCGAYP